LHLRLFPYEWTYAQRIAVDGRPIQRALGLAYPELGVHPDDTYLFGDDLLVAPVVKRGAREREVVFPPGAWIDWWDGTRYEGNQTVTVDAPLGKLPLYLREGGIIPMLRPTIDSMAPTLHPEQVDSYASTPGILHARIVAGAAATSFTLFDGAVVGQAREGNTLMLSSQDGKEFTQGMVFEVIAQSGAPSSVRQSGVEMIPVGSVDELDQATTGWVHVPSERGGTLYVKVSGGDHEVTVKF